MKKRLYQRNVVDAIPKLNKQRDDFARECRKKLGCTLLAFVFCVAAACCCSVFISRFAVYLFIPVMVRKFSYEFYCCYQNFKLLKIMSLDDNDYAVWMKNQLNKGNTKKDIQFQTSIETYKKYAIDFPYNHSEIYQDLQNLLKKKTDNQILVSLLCGLLFASGEKKYRDVIFNAKYKKGSAGNMVLSAWILFLDGDLSEDITYDKLKNDFLDFWNSQC